MPLTINVTVHNRVCFSDRGTGYREGASRRRSRASLLGSRLFGARDRFPVNNRRTNSGHLSLSSSQ